MSARIKDEIDGETLLFGIIGYPVSHSKSPNLHNAAFQSKNINAVYVPLAVPKATAALKKGILGFENMKGVSVTIPHKAWACRSADERDALSECCGASNTLIRTPDGKLQAYNTDGYGALEALRRNVKRLGGKRILLIGYGGSATAIAHSLLLEESPAVLCIAGRNKTKRKKFTAELQKAHSPKNTLVRETDYTDLKPEDIDIIIHTTPLGMKGQSTELPLPQEFIQSFHTVFDIVYNPARTPLLKLAARRKAQTIPGYLMLLFQAVKQYELFTGQKAPVNLMEQVLVRSLRTKG